MVRKGTKKIWTKIVKEQKICQEIKCGQKPPNKFSAIYYNCFYYSLQDYIYKTSNQMILFKKEDVYNVVFLLTFV